MKGEKVKTKELTKPVGKDLVDWEEQLAADAVEAKGKIAGTGGGQFASIRGGTLTVGGNPIPNNELACVILAFANQKAYYEKEFDPSTPASPECYAFGDDAASMQPHSQCEKPQSEACKGCQHNEFGTALRGKGKRCRDSVKLALIPAGSLVGGVFHPITETEAFKKADVVMLSVPPTSIAAFGNYARALAGVQHRPPYGAFTKISVRSDPKKQVAVSFDCLAMAPTELLSTLRERSKSVETSLAVPFPKLEEKTAPPTKAGKPGKSKY